MKARANIQTPKAAFTLIEMIGVMAIMAILATVATPGVLRMLDTAAVQAEEGAMQRLADQIRRYTRDTGAAPTGANWSNVLQSYTDLSANDLLQNKRGKIRILLTDTTTNRVMILSAMSGNVNLTLPTAVSAANFDLIWRTSDNTIPTTASWGGWASWNNIRNSYLYLSIQRINLGAELQTFPIVLKHSGTVAARYEVIPSNASSGTIVLFPVGAAQVSLSLRARQRVNLYPTSAATIPSYTYVVSTTGKTLEFTSGNFWTAQ